MYFLLLCLLNLGIGTNGDIPNTELISNYSVTGNRYPRQANSKRCQIPVDPHGQYSFINYNPSSYTTGNYANEFTFALLNCDSSYKRTPLGQQYSVCENGFWSPAHKCELTCSTLMSTDSTNIRCYFNDLELESCENPLSGTIAEFDCQPYHENLNLGSSFVQCENGEWIGIKHECVPICGERRSVGRTNVINGTNAEKGSYPWHVGLYTASKDFICGGSIISQRVILTAAHCISDNDNGTPYPKEQYLVTVGKYFRQYDDPRDVNAQYPIIESFHVPTEYRGDQLHHETDIAVIVLTANLVLSDVVQPICIDWFRRYEAEQLILNNHGVVVGWGYTMEGRDLANELKELSVPYIPFDQCYRQVPRNFTKYVRPDKICGGYIDLGTSVCGGDSGGALTFPLLSNGKYYIRGIVSVSPATENIECNSRQYGLYTSLSRYLSFVRRLYISNRSFSTITSTPSTTPLPTLKSDGNSCTISSTEIHGQCKLLSACPVALRALQTRQIHPQICRFSNSEAIVCCVGSDDADSLPSANPTTQNPNLGKKSKQKCQEYGQFVDAGECKLVSAESIVSVEQAQPKEFPHMVRAMIGYDSYGNTYWGCGGSLISDKFVLTSALCLKHPGHREAKYVRLGELVKYQKEENPEKQDFNVLTRYFHPDYSPPSHYNDIGLLELDRKAKLNAFVRPACLNVNPNIVNTYMVVSAWGRNNSEFHNDLLKVSLELFTNNECNRTYKNFIRRLSNGIVDETQICLGSRNESKDICEDSSGAPLQISNSDEVSCTYKIIGITSFRRVCASMNVPGVYTRVSSYISWIENIVWP